MDAIRIVLDKINELIWGYPMIILLVATHVYLTVKLKFIQKYILKAIKLSVKKDDSAGMVSNFGALSVSLAATIGTGSIIGMSTAISIGGPGAVFWMVCIGCFGIATKYAECVLAVKYRVKNEVGEQVGGSMYIMKNVLNMKWMGIIFAVSGLLMALTGGGMLQVNAIADILGDAYKTNHIVVGIVVASVVAVVILGGVKSIARWCELLVPLMGSIYLLTAIGAFIIHIEHVPAVVALIFKGAFSFESAGGGMLGAGIMAAIHTGASRSVLSTEAGMGSASVVAAAAKTENPVRQGLVASTSVFWTMFICSLTGFIILVAGDWQSGNKFAGDLCNSAFSSIPYVGVPALVCSLVIFSFTTIIGWTYYGEKFIEFLGGHKFVIPFRIFWILCMVVGALVSSKFAWSVVVLITACMSVPNLVMIFLLRNDIVKETDKYIKKEVDSI